MNPPAVPAASPELSLTNYMSVTQISIGLWMIDTISRQQNTSQSQSETGSLYAADHSQYGIHRSSPFRGSRTRFRSDRPSRRQSCLRFI